MANSDSGKTAAQLRKEIEDFRKTMSPSTRSKVEETQRQVEKQAKERVEKEFKKGGHVKKTGIYKLHKGEKVVPAHAVRSQMKARKGKK